MTPKIIGGSTVEDGSYDFFVQGQGCGGSLVAADVVLTAAHCYDNFASAGNVFVGNYQLDSITEGAESRAIVSDMVVHPSYNSDTVSNDLMLFKIEWSSKTPIQLNSDTNAPYDNQGLTAIGFGHLVFDGQLSDTLQRADLHYVPDEECSWTYTLDESMMCAMEDGMSQTTCQGDSGGPIFDEGSRTLMGATSFGLEGCSPDSPTVFARVSYNIGWIQETICALTDTSPDFCGGGGYGDDISFGDDANGGYNYDDDYSSGYDDYSSGYGDSYDDGYSSGYDGNDQYYFV